MRFLSVCALAWSCLAAGCQNGQVQNGSDAEMPVASNSGGAINYAQEGPDGSHPESEFSTTPSGLKYRILRDGSGPKPSRQSTVSVSYRGWLDNGSEFDSSYQRSEPTTFPLGGVIPGWTEGLQLVGEGGKIELEIPSDLGYGPQGMPGAIPPNATLHFVVELHDVL